MLLSLNQITKTFRVGLTKRVCALDNVTYGVRPGSIVGLVGPNGSGKSTSLKIALGLVRPDSGEVSIFGGSPTDPSRFRRLGFLPENVSFSETLNAVEILDYVASVHGLERTGRRPRIDLLLEKVGLAEHRRKTIRQYSKGMQQRLGFACALLADPELLVLDEPMSGLDPIGRRFVIDLLASEHARGKTILFSSHLLHDIDQLCDELVVVVHSKLIYAGPKDGFVSRKNEYRLVFTHDVLPAWIQAVSQLGPRTWLVKGPEHVLVENLVRLREEGARIVEFSPEASLENSFFEILEHT